MNNIIVLSLIICIPVTTLCVCYFFHKTLKEFSRHLEEVQMVGGQPKKVVENRALLEMEERKSHQEQAKNRLKNISVDQIMS